VLTYAVAHLDVKHILVRAASTRARVEMRAAGPLKPIVFPEHRP
jgi:ribosomal protein L22